MSVFVPAVARIKCSNPVWEPQLLKPKERLCLFVLCVILSSPPSRIDHHPETIFHHCNALKETRRRTTRWLLQWFLLFLSSLWSISHGGRLNTLPEVPQKIFFFGLSKTHYPYLSSFMSKWWPFPWNMLLSPVTTIVYQSLTPRLIGLFGIHFAVISNAVVSSTLIMTPLSRIWALGGIYIRLIPRALFICYYITSAYRGKKSMKIMLVINWTGCQNQLI